ncbi:MAG: SDR family oxidoreductase, partial [Bacteroidaceae bacterium]|nr:SDR family oxidoreductase [Bacteroidaceae bacterium]
MAEGAILITGATGLVGTEVVAHLLATTECDIYVLVRAENDGEAERRLRALWWDCEPLASAVGKRVLPVVGDITQHITNVPPCITHV